MVEHTKRRGLPKRPETTEDVIRMQSHLGETIGMQSELGPRDGALMLGVVAGQHAPELPFERRTVAHVFEKDGSSSWFQQSPNLFHARLDADVMHDADSMDHIKTAIRKRRWIDAADHEVDSIGDAIVTGATPCDLNARRRDVDGGHVRSELREVHRFFALTTTEVHYR
jgi:hypothetical protein